MRATHEHVALELRQATSVLSCRGLSVSAKWAAEMLCGLPVNADDFEVPCDPYIFDAAVDTSEAEQDTFTFAKTLHNCREFRRAAHVLDKGFGESGEYPSKAFFLRCYSLYLVSAA
jgi:hypothetical protein